MGEPAKWANAQKRLGKAETQILKARIFSEKTTSVSLEQVFYSTRATAGVELAVP